MPRHHEGAQWYTPTRHPTPHAPTQHTRPHTRARTSVYAYTHALFSIRCALTRAKFPCARALLSQREHSLSTTKVVRVLRFRIRSFWRIDQEMEERMEDAMAFGVRLPTGWCCL